MAHHRSNLVVSGEPYRRFTERDAAHLAELLAEHERTHLLLG